MKAATEYVVTCDIVGCEAREFYFSGQEERMSKIGWAFVYPETPKDEFDCWTLCPKHAKHAPLFDRKHTPTEEREQLKRTDK
jgi:hypothetical protein